MVDKSLTALVRIARGIDTGKVLLPEDLISEGLREEVEDLEKKKFIERIKKDGRVHYSPTSIGKSVLGEIDEFYEISYTAHIF
ncbi:MAG: hypothetical protein ABIH28_01395 [archaeon]